MKKLGLMCVALAAVFCPSAKGEDAAPENSPEWTGARYFTNNLPWTISSSLSGTEGLGKWGPGDLTITSLSDFTGDVILAGGETILIPYNDGRICRTPIAWRSS